MAQLPAAATSQPRPGLTGRPKRQSALLRKAGLSAVIALGAIACAAAERCLVVGVTDGDTLKARCETADAVRPFQEVKIRLAGIDAPESGQDFGTQSKRALSDICYRQMATIRPESTDRYGRTVASVECGGSDAAAQLVGTGMAWVYDKYSRGHENLYPLQQAARQARRGLLAQDAVPPWEWRRESRARGKERGA